MDTDELGTLEGEGHEKCLGGYMHGFFDPLQIPVQLINCKEASCKRFLLVIVSVAGFCWPQCFFLQWGGVEQHATDPPRVT